MNEEVNAAHVIRARLVDLTFSFERYCIVYDLVNSTHVMHLSHAMSGVENSAHMLLLIGEPNGHSFSIVSTE